MSNDVMDIKLSKVTGKCDEKCMFKYKYNTSPTCIVTNNTTNFSLSYDKSSTSPVTFNNNDYQVESIYLYFHSVHYFNGSYSEGEIIITHKSISGGEYLMVCLPLSTKNGFPSNLLNNILNKIIYIQNGDSETIKLDVDYNLNDIVKYDSYYYYSDDNNYNIICYGLPNAIYVPENLINNIKGGSSSIANPLTTEIYPMVNSLFYNSKGPTKYNSDEIYIDCNPVNSSGNEQILFENGNNNPETNLSLPKAPQNMNLLEIIGIFLFIVCLFVAGTKIYHSINKPKSSITSIFPSKPTELFTKNNDLLQQLLAYLLEESKNLKGVK